MSFMPLLWFLSLFIYFNWAVAAGGGGGVFFTLQNKCSYTVWPGILAGAGHPLLANGGFELKPNAEVSIPAPKGWSGRFWGRRGCNFDESGHGKCPTGDCGGGVLQCAGAGGIPPASLAEFTLDSPVDFYDVSLVDGYNIPISISPNNGTTTTGNNCTEVKCSFDLNNCPEELKLRSGSDDDGAAGGGQVIGCKSACLALNKPEYCCTGCFNDPNVCKPTDYSKIFKNACPTSYSFPYDDKTSTFTCKDASYTITFC